MLAIDGNFVGTDATGSSPVPNGGIGLEVNGARSTDIGLTVGNVLSGNVRDGVVVTGGASTTTMENNLIGVAANGTSPLGNGGNGVVATGNSTFTYVGTNTVGNVIGANAGHGVHVNAAGDNTRVWTNFIGTDVSGTIDLGNTGAGVSIESIAVSDFTTNYQNTIAFNGDDGIEVLPSTAGIVAILTNQTYANGGIGIDLNNDGPTPNDSGDGDSGPNGLLNHPIIIGFNDVGAGQFTVDYEVDAPAANYVIETYNNPSGPDPTGYGESEDHLQFTTISHPGGVASYTTPNMSMSEGDIITALLHVNGGGNVASELSPFAVVGSTVTVNSTGDAMDLTPGDGICNTGRIQQ